MDNALDRKIDVTANQFLLVQNRQQAHDWNLIGWGANGLGIQESINKMDQSTILIKSYKTSNKILISADLSIIHETPKTFLKYNNYIS